MKAILKLIFLLEVLITFSNCYVEVVTVKNNLTESSILISQTPRKETHKFINNQRILNGDLSTECKHRYLVSVMRLYNNVPVLQCGGAIIHRRYVLTAAHCVYRFRSTDLIVRHGGACGLQLYAPQETNRTFYSIVKTFIPTTYSDSPCRKHQNDIAILKVHKAFDLTDTSRFVKVNLPEFDADYEGHLATVTGCGPDFGPLVEENQKKTKYLQYVVKLRVMPSIVISNEDCQSRSNVVLTEGNLCVKALNPESQTCFEDDGGPLIYDGTIIGILNDRKCDYNIPETFTRVTSFLHFIKTVLEHQQSYDVLLL